MYFFHRVHTYHYTFAGKWTMISSYMTRHNTRGMVAASSTCRISLYWTGQHVTEENKRWNPNCNYVLISSFFMIVWLLNIKFALGVWILTLHGIKFLVPYDRHIILRFRLVPRSTPIQVHWQMPASKTRRNRTGKTESVFLIFLKVVWIWNYILETEYMYIYSFDEWKSFIN